MNIDLVYLWVDENDKNWREKKSKYTTKSYNKDAVDDCRFVNNDELKYSLRSIEKYAPWINRIFLVTDNQTPEWLNLENKKIKIVDHSEIIPQDKLPLFNSCAIESRIPYIPELSEYFLYANDDTLLWDNVDKDFFFVDEKPVCRVDKRIWNFRIYKHLYGHTIQRAYNLVKKRLNKNIPAFFPHHGIDAYRKSLFLECIEEFKPEFDETLNHRFRKFTDMQRMCVTYYTLAKNMGELRNIQPSFYNRYFKKLSTESKCYNITTSAIKEIQKVNTKLLCINDCRKTKPEDRKNIKVLLEQKFPQKSEFELY